MEKFEYCYISSVQKNSTDNTELHLSDGSFRNVKQELFEVLNELGKDGWEMVGCGSIFAEYHNIYFKRQIEC